MDDALRHMVKAEKILNTLTGSLPQGDPSTAPVADAKAAFKLAYDALLDAYASLNAKPGSGPDTTGDGHHPVPA
jgi:hypothetical protein